MPLESCFLTSGPHPANTLYLPTPFPNHLQASGLLPLSCRGCRCAPLPRRLSTPIDSSKPSKTPKHLPHATEKVFAFWTLMTLGHPLRPLSQQPDFVVLCVQPARSLQRINSLESGLVLTRPSPPHMSVSWEFCRSTNTGFLPERLWFSGLKSGSGQSTYIFTILNTFKMVKI